MQAEAEKQRREATGVWLSRSRRKSHRGHPLGWGWASGRQASTAAPGKGSVQPEGPASHAWASGTSLTSPGAARVEVGPELPRTPGALLRTTRWGLPSSRDFHAVWIKCTKLCRNDP